MLYPTIVLKKNEIRATYLSIVSTRARGPRKGYFVDPCLKTVSWHVLPALVSMLPPYHARGFNVLTLPNR